MSSFALKRAAAMAAFGVSFAWLGPRSAPPEHPLAARAHVPETPRAVAIESLHDWQPHAPTPFARSRNLFAYRTTLPLERTVVEQHASEPRAAQSGPSAPPAMQLALIGMAEDPGPSELARTAILSGEGQVFVVTAGDAVTSRYRVASVSSNVVDLTDLQTGTLLRLTLK